MRPVKRRLPTAAALLTALAFTASSTPALAQSAGGQQYSDPLAAVHRSQTHQKTTTSTTSTGPKVTTAPPVNLSSTTTTPATSTSSPSSSSTSSSNLPRTGLNLGLLVALAAVLLLAGVGLRLRTTGVRRR
jgi:cobalamin biosynthesis Mg chelatase CobN